MNGREAIATSGNFAEWEAVLDGTPAKVHAFAEDTAGNDEKRGHVWAVRN